MFCQCLCVFFYSLYRLISGPKQFSYKGNNYFFSGHVRELAGRKVDWLDGRNICREYCMDLVSLETQEENNMIFRLIQQSEYFQQFAKTCKNLRKTHEICTILNITILCTLSYLIILYLCVYR